ncbi:MAG: hypothetical protein JNL11_00355 [Bdellovibrionaceae bacterium]|nr:hypothetical protein [Pseudobdellovibrionaceae bacterium]
MDGVVKRLSKLVFIFSILLAFSAHAQSDDSRELVEQELEKNRIENYSFDYTLNLCRYEKNVLGYLDHRLKVSLARQKIMAEGFKASVWTLDPLAVFKPTWQTKIFLTSPGFKKAVEICFPNDSFSQAIFKWNLAAADVDGHLVGLGAFVLSGFTLKWIQASAWAVRYASAFKTLRYLTYAAGTFVVGGVAYQEMEKFIRNYRDSNPKSLGETLEQTGKSAIDSACELVVIRSRELDQELKNPNIQPDRKKALLDYQLGLGKLCQKQVMIP